MWPSLARRRPSSVSPFGRVSRDLDEYMGSLLGPWLDEGGLQQLTAAYPVDIREDDQRVYVDAEMPGFDKEEIDVTLDRGVLTIVGEHKEEKEPKGEEAKGQDRLRERRYNRVERSFTLPQTSNESNVDARLEKGVLHLVIDKAKEAPGKKIEVK